MKSDLIKIPVSDLSRKEWLAERSKGIGGSDVAAIYGLDRYKPAVKLFYQKAGIWDTDEGDNLAAYSGRVNEDNIYENYWRYWDPDNNNENVMLDNANSGNVIRKARRVNHMIINPKYPWLRANIDYQISKYKDRNNGILELKFVNSSHWSSYKDGIPPGYLLQLQTYIGVCEYDHGEIFAVKDGRFPVMFSFKFDKEIFDRILHRTKDFYDTVQEAKSIWKDKSLTREEKEGLIGQIEPGPENTEAYEMFMKDRYKDGYFNGSVKSDSEVENHRYKYWAAHNEAKDNETAKQYHKNCILKYMSNNGSNAIILDNEKMIKLVENRLTIPKLTKDERGE